MAADCVLARLGNVKGILHPLPAVRPAQVQELYRGEVIPLFIELRRLKPETELLENLLEHMELLGFGANLGLFEFIAQSGKLLVCLDGFDEVKDSLREGLIQQIEMLCIRFDQLAVLITSRPDNGINNSPLFRVVRLAPLGDGEIRGVINRMADDPILTDQPPRSLESMRPLRYLLARRRLLIEFLSTSSQGRGQTSRQL